MGIARRPCAQAARGLLLRTRGGHISSIAAVDTASDPAKLHDWPQVCASKTDSMAE